MYCLPLCLSTLTTPEKPGNTLSLFGMLNKF